jgi:hypothetical protein
VESGNTVKEERHETMVGKFMKLKLLDEKYSKAMFS